MKFDSIYRKLSSIARWIPLVIGVSCTVPLPSILIFVLFHLPFDSGTTPIWLIVGCAGLVLGLFVFALLYPKPRAEET